MGLLDWLFKQRASGQRSRAELSAEFLETHKGRLDAIGPWSIEADTDNLDIHWSSPASLQGQWVPLDLEFHTDSGTATFDPDERMFDLWALFLSRKPVLVRQLQDLTEAAAQVIGVVETARVVVYREGHGGEDASYTLQVLFTFAGDPEHLYWTDYDEETGGFTALDC